MVKAAPRTLVVSVAVAVTVGLLVLLVVSLRGETYEGRVGLIAGPASGPLAGTADAAGTGATAQYGEVVSLTLPALVELARSPTVLKAAAAQVGTTADGLGRNIAVELVPASGLARLSVRAESAEVAGGLATTIAKALIDADLLAPVGRLRLLDEQADVTRVAPDWFLAVGLALAAAVAAATATAVVCRLWSPAAPVAVREALTAAGIPPAIAIVRDGEPGLVERLSLLGEVAGRRIRIVATCPELGDRAASLREQLGTADGIQGVADAAVIAVADGSRGRQTPLIATIGVLPSTATVIAVVLA